MIIIVLAVVAIVFAAIAGLAFLSTATTVSVNAIIVTSADNVCGLDGAVLGGFVATASSAVNDAMSVTNANLTQSCTIVSVTSATAGFTVATANTPLTIPASSSATLRLTIDCPGAYSGQLTLNVE